MSLTTYRLPGNSGPGLGVLGQAGGNTVIDALSENYQDVREWCIETYGAERCNSFLPQNVYNAIGQPRESRLPWWAWMLLGALAGRMLRV